MTVLVIDPDAHLVDILTFALRRYGYDPVTATDGDTGLRVWRRRNPTLVLVAVDTPEVNGWEVCRRIRSADSTPVILLAERPTEDEQIRGLDLGADDVVSKPFGVRLLAARMAAVLRRQGAPAEQPHPGAAFLAVGPLGLDPQWLTMHVGERSSRLTRLEFKVLYELVRHSGQVLTYEQLVERVWGYVETEPAGLLKSHILHLRQKLARVGCDPALVLTVPGVGYCFQSGPLAADVPAAAAPWCGHG